MSEIAAPRLGAARSNGPRWRAALDAAAVVVIGYVIVALLGMGALRLYTELAPREVFGEFNLLVTILTLGIQLFVAPFTNTQLRYHSEALARGAGDSFTREALLWALRGAAVLAVAGCVGWLLHAYFGGPRLGVGVAIAGLLWIVATTVRNVLMSRLQAERRRRTYAVLQMVEALATAVLTGGALWVAADTESFFAGQFLAAVLLVVIGLRFVSVPIAANSDEAPGGAADFRSKARSYGLPFAPLALASWLSNLGDRYVLGLLLGASAVGQYVAPLAIASRPMILVSSALSDLFRPSLFDAENLKQQGRADRLFALWVAANVVVGAVAVLCVAVVGQWAVSMLLGASYRAGAVTVMIWVTAGYAVFGLTQVLENRLLSLGRSAHLLLPMAVGAIANVGFSWALIARHGVTGAAEASCAGFGVRALVTAALLVRPAPRLSAA